MEGRISFVGGGKMGDYIHQLFVVKNLCELTHSKADLFIRDNGQTWTFGLKRAYEDLLPLISQQDYIGRFQIGNTSPAVDLDAWRHIVMPHRMTTGAYKDSWTQLMTKVYGFSPRQYAWLKATPNESMRGVTLIHESLHRKNSRFDYEPYLKDAVFITSNIEEFEAFKHKDRVSLHLCSLEGMASAMAGCELFIGNQSMPLALATALDVKRIGVLDHDAAPFYTGEENYSTNFSWFL